MGQGYYNDYRVVIMSWGRADTIITQKIFPKADIVVPESQVKKYKDNLPNHNIVACPDKTIGISKVRNWIINNYPEKVICMADDDLKGLVNLTRKNPVFITDGEQIEWILESCIACADDIGTKIFGFNHQWDIRKYRSNDPFRFNSWTGCFLGVIGKDLVFDENNNTRVDIDAFLQTLMRQRVTWVDKRYSFYGERFKNKGGSSELRTSNSEELELKYLKEKWGKHIKYIVTKVGMSIRLDVKRVQK